MKLIGICGYIGSGKTTMINYLKTKPNFFVIEADEISKHVLYEKNVLSFLKTNIPECLTNNIIDKDKLRNTVFNNPEINDKFVAIMWPLITLKIKEIIKGKKNNYEIIFVEAAMINGLDIKFNKTILLTKSESQRLDSVKKRDNREFEEIKSITKYQKEKLKNMEFDYTLVNNHNKTTFYKKIDELIEKIK
ncbi:dephospho-CoA kinase [Spiroplasma gladiatoris]|uniref:Dephospho-CoA kinase n=1 Tax=Spiroplasma gladiatoris TaxID=2143 RepID=A0A4P7AJ05_9MOLU|nr:dephospho-CoA kinase [Spiroplasma gladiatoris]QBQ07713.1 dephospho-CoA kinase [Spiroplasma gladiatoris]